MTDAAPRTRRRSVGVADALLAWYDANRRELPWRAAPGVRPDPYAVWLSEIMLQQTTVVTVADYFRRFLARWPDVRALAAAPTEDVLAEWAGLGYYARARNLVACARMIVAAHGGRFPASEAALLDLPGVGPYTAAAIAAIAFDAPCVAVDGNVERVAARLFAIGTPATHAKRVIRDKMTELAPDRRAGDFVQALMDLGAGVCTPRSPRCEICPLAQFCVARREGAPTRYPVKAPKPAKPRRRAAIFICRRGAATLLVRAPEKGLFGGMNVFPSTPLTRDVAPENWLDFAPRPAEWRPLEGEIAHVFTHFALGAQVLVSRVGPRAAAPPAARWVSCESLAAAGLPTLMRKAAVQAGLFGEEGA